MITYLHQILIQIELSLIIILFWILSMKLVLNILNAS
jgi:hypothetical protein